MHAPRVPTFLAKAGVDTSTVGTPRFVGDRSQQAERDAFLNQQPGDDLAAANEADREEHLPADAPPLEAEVAPPAPLRNRSSMRIPIPDPPADFQVDARPVAGPSPDVALVTPRLDAAILLLRRTGEALAEQARSDALEIGFQVARRIIGAEVRADVEPLLSFIKEALKHAGDERVIQLRLNPDDVAAIEAQSGAIPQLDITTAHFELTPDPSLERGDCVLITEGGEVDGRLQTRLQELQQAARRALAEQNADEQQDPTLRAETLEPSPGANAT